MIWAGHLETGNHKQPDLAPGEKMEGAQTGVEEKGMLGKYGLDEEKGGREAQTSDGRAEPSPQV